MNTHKKRYAASGFTLVELLIVIVVIAILATISIISYNGIQQRARNTQTVNAAHDYLTALQAYLAQNGSYPVVPTGPMYCLGQDAVYCTTATGNWTRSAALESALQTIISALPVPSDGPGTAATSDGDLGYIPARSPSTSYPTLDGVNSAFLIYILEGYTSCPVGPVASGGWPSFFSTPPSSGPTYYHMGVSVCWVPLNPA